MEGEIPMKTLLLVLFFGLMVPPAGLAQKGRKETLEGNQLYGDQQYEQALDKYRQGLRSVPDSSILQFNIGDAEYKLERFQDALESYNQTLEATNEPVTSHALYNLGNTFYRLGKYQESIEAYEEALRLNPDDQDAKFNLEKALQQRQLNPPQQSPDQQEGENQEDQSEDDRQESDQSSEESQIDQPSEDLDRNQAEEDQPKLGHPPETSPQERRASAEQPENLSMTQEQAEQILEALQENPKDFLKGRVVRGTPREGEKDW